MRCSRSLSVIGAIVERIFSTTDFSISLDCEKEVDAMNGERVAVTAVVFKNVRRCIKNEELRITNE